MHKTLIATVLATLVLAGCTTTAEERLANDRNTCRAYGFTEGSEAFANCLLQLDLDRRAAQRDRMDRIRFDPPPRIVIVQPSG